MNKQKKKFVAYLKEGTFFPRVTNPYDSLEANDN